MRAMHKQRVRMSPSQATFGLLLGTLETRGEAIFKKAYLKTLYRFFCKAFAYPKQPCTRACCLQGRQIGEGK